MRPDDYNGRKLQRLSMFHHRDWVPDSETLRCEVILVRNALRVTQDELAARAGVSRVGVANFERGHRGCSMDWGSKLWEALCTFSHSRKGGVK